MAVPKHKRTSSRRDQRRMHIFLKKPTLTKCPKCQKPVLPHTVCQNCGFYKGVEVINVLEKLTKKEKKLREKEMKAKDTAEKREGGAAPEKPMSWEEMSKK